jgi:hypothetical protein
MATNADFPNMLNQKITKKKQPSTKGKLKEKSPWIHMETKGGY